MLLVICVSLVIIAKPVYFETKKVSIIITQKDNNNVPIKYEFNVMRYNCTFEFISTLVCYELRLSELTKDLERQITSQILKNNLYEL